MQIIKDIDTIYLKSDDSDLIGEIHFQKPNDMFIIIDHTKVLAKYEGHGYARILVEEAVNYAKDNNLKVVPLCPYARKLFNENNDYQEIEYHS